MLCSITEFALQFSLLCRYARPLDVLSILGYISVWIASFPGAGSPPSLAERAWEQG